MAGSRKTDVNVNGGNNLIAPNATIVNSRSKADGKSLTLADIQNGSGKPCDRHATRYRIFASHDLTDVAKAMSKAKKHIVLHAAYYPKYAIGNYGQVLYETLEHNKELKLTVVFTDVSSSPWLDEFARVLRTNYKTVDDFRNELEATKGLFRRLQQEHRKSRVEVLSTSQLPMFPVVLVDSTLFVGHYSHSRIPAPDGLWLVINNSKISQMYADLLAGSAKIPCNAEDKAIFRYLEEIANAVANGTSIFFD